MKSTHRVVFAAAVAAAVGAGSWVLLSDRSAPPTPPAARPAPPKPPPNTVIDVLAPGRDATIDPSRSVPAEGWVRARPAQAFQYSLPKEERGGVEPCGTPAPKLAAGEQWQALSTGKLFIPEGEVTDAQGRFRLIFHLHGEEPIRRELAASKQPFVLYALTLGLDKSYAPPFSGSGLFGRLVEDIARAVSARSGRPARADKIALTAWSAGFEGIRALLHQPDAQGVDALVLIDGLHAPRGGDAMATRLTPFVAFAERAARKQAFMVVTHSSIDTPGYASTTETAHHLIAALSAVPTPVRRKDEFGLELVEFFSRGDLHVRGYAGNDKADHCAQIFLLRSVFGELGRRWR